MAARRSGRGKEEGNEEGTRRVTETHPDRKRGAVEPATRSEASRKRDALRKRNQGGSGSRAGTRRDTEAQHAVRRAKSGNATRYGTEY